jgi:uncharacterized Zn finger protein (UPF0148 family)
MRGKLMRDLINYIGDMMLSGWKMLATHCPICYSALLAKEERKFCASCNVPVMTQEQYDSGKENDGSNNTINSNNALSNSVSSGGNSVVFNTKFNTNHLYESTLTDSPSLLATEIARGRQIQEQTQTSVQIAETAKIHEYGGYYSDNDEIGVTNTLEEQKKLYDLENKKRDIISAKLGEICVLYILQECVYSYLNAIFMYIHTA